MADVKKNDFHILCVDDEEMILEVLQDYIVELGFTPLVTSNPEEVPELVRKYQNSLILIISDFKMPPFDGLKLREKLLPDYEKIPFAILSGHVTREMALEGLERKICCFAEKPFTKEGIFAIIEKESKARAESLKEDRELLDGFISDATNLLEELEPLILSLETAPSDMDVLNNIYRILHTIKGTSAFFDETINKFSHRFEDMLSQFKTGAAVITPDAVTVMLGGFDTLTGLIASIKNPTERPHTLEQLLPTLDWKSQGAAKDKTAKKGEGDKTPEIKAPKARDWLKVSTATLDEFMELSGQITVIRNMVNKLVRSIEKEFTGNKDVSLLGELLEEMHKINSSMQDRMIDLRKQSLKETFKPFPRLMRDLSESLEKEIVLTVKGDELRVDNAVAEVLSNSLVHMLRNCCDHGIESPDDRVKGGKSREGNVSLSCREEGEDIIVELSDDGRGIDPERIKKKLREKGMFPAAAIEAMSEPKLFSMIFEPGFSTAAVVTDVSGRGVGMDMVKTSVEKVRGSIDIQSKLGQGTRFVLRLPIPKSVLIINSLLVEVSREIFAIPQDNILRLLSVEKEKLDEKIPSLQGARVLELDGHLVPVVWLSDLLDLPKAKGDHGAVNVVVLNAEGGYFGVVVDSILNVEDSVVKPLGRHLSKLPAYSGATFLGDGKVGLILNVEKLANLAQVSLEQQRDRVQKSSVGDKSAERSHGEEFLLFDLETRENLAVPLAEIYRLEEFGSKSVQSTGKKQVCIYRDTVMPVIPLGNVLGLEATVPEYSSTETRVPCIVFYDGKKYVAFALKTIRDIAVAQEAVNSDICDRAGIRGTVYLKEKTFSVIDVKTLISLSNSVEKEA